MLSARNQFAGTIKSVTLGNVAAEVVVQVGKLEIVSMITCTSAKQVKAVIKSTEVLIEK